MKSANERLSVADKDLDIEKLNDESTYIEMELGLGVLEEQQADSYENIDQSSVEPPVGVCSTRSDKSTDKDALNTLLGRPSKSSRANIVEVSPKLER